MKVLFIASQDDEQSPLLIEREMTLLQQRAFAASGQDVTFHFLPDISVEELPLELARHRPDVLHISAHGTKAGLEFTNSSKKPVVVTPAQLLDLLHPEHPPKLIYLNGCELADMAGKLTARVPMAVGSTALISNRAAMTAAVLFYDRLIGGFSVQQAFDTAKAIILAIHAQSASAKLFKRRGVVPAQERLHQVPHIVADLKYIPSETSKKHFNFELGLIGCRHDTVQVIFFTDDETFILEDDEIENELCELVRQTPTQGAVWGDFEWGTEGDFNLYACATTSGGQSYTVATTLCQAVEAKLRLIDHLAPDEWPANLSAALTRLRSEDGSRLIARTAPKRKGKRKRQRPQAKPAGRRKRQ